MMNSGSSRVHCLVMPCVALRDWLGSSCTQCLARTLVSRPNIADPLFYKSQVPVLHTHRPSRRLENPSSLRHVYARCQHQRSTVLINQKFQAIPRIMIEMIESFSNVLRDSRLAFAGQHRRGHPVFL